MCGVFGFSSIACQFQILTSHGMDQIIMARPQMVPKCMQFQTRFYAPPAMCMVGLISCGVWVSGPYSLCLWNNQHSDCRPLGDFNFNHSHWSKVDFSLSAGGFSMCKNWMGKSVNVNCRHFFLLNDPVTEQIGVLMGQNSPSLIRAGLRLSDGKLISQFGPVCVRNACNLIWLVL